MNLRTYSKERKRTETWTRISDEKVCMLCFGLAGETGEVIDYLKKVGFHGHPFDKQKLMKELGDLIWYLVGLMSHFNIEIEDVLDLNIEKLKERYPEGFSTAASIKRKDEVIQVD